MKKLTILLAVAALVLGLIGGPVFADEAAPAAPLAKIKTGDTLTDDLKATTLDGTVVDLMKSTIGKFTIFQFMTTACGACQAELVNLLRLQKELGADAFSIIPIAMDILGTEAVNAYEARNKFGVNYLIDPDFSLPPRFGFNYTPSFMVVDSSGKVVLTQGGYADAAWTMIKDKIVKAVQ